MQLDGHNLAARRRPIVVTSSPPVFDAATSHDAAGTAGPVTISHTTSGSNRLLLVGVYTYGHAGSPPSGVTYNGVAMTLVEDIADSTGELSLWRLIAPATGLNDVVVSLNGTVDIGMAIVSYTGVNQTTPLGTPAEASANTVNVSSASGELVVDVVGNYNAAMTAGASQTARVSGGPATVGCWGSSEEAGTGTVTMSWSGATGSWIIIGVPLKPV